MTRWILRRIAVSVALAWIVATLVFLALHMVPGDPAELLLSAGNVAPDPAASARPATAYFIRPTVAPQRLRPPYSLDSPLAVSPTFRTFFSRSSIASRPALTSAMKRATSASRSRTTTSSVVLATAAPPRRRRVSGGAAGCQRVVSRA